jgi:hypothetical protein
MSVCHKEPGCLDGARRMKPAMNYRAQKKSRHCQTAHGVNMDTPHVFPFSSVHGATAVRPRHAGPPQHTRRLTNSAYTVAAQHPTPSKMQSWIRQCRLGLRVGEGRPIFSRIGTMYAVHAAEAVPNAALVSNANVPCAAILPSRTKRIDLPVRKLAMRRLSPSPLP